MRSTSGRATTSAAEDGRQHTVYKIRFWDKVRALELLAKHFALLTEQIEVKDSAEEARVARLLAGGGGSPNWPDRRRDAPAR
jgi:hypothetical protein